MDRNFGDYLRNKYKFALIDLICSYSKKFINNNYSLAQYPIEWNNVKDECLADNNQFVEFINEHFEFGSSFEITEYSLKQYFKIHKIDERIKFVDECKKARWNIKRNRDTKKWIGLRIKQQSLLEDEP